MTTHFKNKKPKKKLKITTSQFTILKTYDTFKIIATIYTSVALSFIAIGMIEVPTSDGLAYSLTFGNKLLSGLDKKENKN